MAQAIRMAHAEDPRLELLNKLRERANGIVVLGASCLIAVYERPEKTAGGLILPGQTRNEDKYQGKVGLVLSLGPIAFEDDSSHRFGSTKPEVGDWVLFNIGDAFGFELDDHRCRIVEDVHIKAILHEPDSVL